ncbi:MAG: nucleoside triphosphate pyrophosphohydrolase [Spirochaeta sp.]|nr:nucleoside triphosphate pyrophosphohydrolase [Spirochaeta sp.]
MQNNRENGYIPVFPEVEASIQPYERRSEADVFQHYAGIIRRLRAADGCPWDRKQTLTTLRRFVVEESFELVAAIHDNDDHHISEELGDVLLVVMLIADALELEFGYTLADVLQQNGEKLIRRHPHVFGAVAVSGSDEVVANWNQIKKEQEGRSESPTQVSPGLPPLEHAYEMQRKVAKVGFDWPDIQSPLQKVREELAELEARMVEIGADTEPSRARDDRQIEDELGDLLFSVVNVSRHLKTDPSVALSRTNRRFQERFTHIERRIAESGRELQDCDLEELDALWDEAKTLERD